MLGKNQELLMGDGSQIGEPPQRKTLSMRFISAYTTFFQRFFPSPFVIAVILSAVVFCAAWFFGSADLSFGETSLAWYNGIWNSGGMVFLVQMMLMLVLGHVLALSAPVERLLNQLLLFANSSAKAIWLVCLISLITCWINWGLGLIVSAVLARKVGEAFSRDKKPLNYALLGAVAYSGMMFWHGGLSGSAPLKVAEEGHLQGLLSGSGLTELPMTVPVTETLFTTTNVVGSILVLLFVPVIMVWVQGLFPESVPDVQSGEDQQGEEAQLSGLEQLDSSSWFAKTLGGVIVCVAVYQMAVSGKAMGAINPNWINTMLLGLAMVCHQHLTSFLRATGTAVQGAVGILLQFPLYFGIMGLMKDSGLVGQIADFFVYHSTQSTFPIFTFISAGVVNLFVPSGGGQWLVQGPIVVQACSDFGIPISKGVMALAYGDQLTNMLQPFWALPLLGITGLKAKEILPFTLMLFVLGGLIYLGLLLV